MSGLYYDAPADRVNFTASNHQSLYEKMNTSATPIRTYNA
jgi:hypothetical protein